MRDERRRLAINMLAGGSGGAYAVGRELLPRLDRGEFDITLFSRVADVGLWSGLMPRSRVLGIRAGDSALARWAWEHTILPGVLRRAGIGSFFSPFGLLPGTLPVGVRTVVAFQNMLPFSTEARRDYGGRAGLRLRLLERQYASAAARADRVIVNCKWCAEQVVLRVPDAADRIAVIPFASSEPGEESEALPGDLRPGSYLLYVSPLTPYKRQLEVVRAYGAAFPSAASAPTLVLAGAASGAYAEGVRAEVVRRNLEQRVLITGFVDRSVLTALYRHCGLFVFASMVESCPNVLLEAMRHALPIACSNAPPMPEYADDAATYFDPRDGDGFAQVLRRVWADEDLRSELRRRSAARHERFDWDTAAGRVAATLLEAALDGIDEGGG